VGKEGVDGKRIGWPWGAFTKARAFTSDPRTQNKNVKKTKENLDLVPKKVGFGQAKLSLKVPHSGGWEKIWVKKKGKKEEGTNGKGWGPGNPPEFLEKRKGRKKTTQ